MKIQDELLKFFKSEQGEQVIGQIMLKALKQAFVREMLFEDGKSEPGRVIEKTVMVNILDHIAKYLPYVEGAIRGCQADSAKARNRATEVCGALTRLETALKNGMKRRAIDKDNTPRITG